MSDEFGIHKMTEAEYKASFKQAFLLMRRAALPMLPVFLFLFMIFYGITSLTGFSGFSGFILFPLSALFMGWLYGLAYLCAEKGSVLLESGYSGTLAMLKSPGFLWHDMLKKFLYLMAIFIAMILISLLFLNLGLLDKELPKPPTEGYDFWVYSITPYMSNMTYFLFLSLILFDNGFGFKTLLRIHTVSLKFKRSDIELLDRYAVQLNMDLLFGWIRNFFILFFVFSVGSGFIYFSIFSIPVVIYTICLNVIWFRLIFMDKKDLEEEKEEVVEKDFVITCQE